DNDRESRTPGVVRDVAQAEFDQADELSPEWQVRILLKRPKLTRRVANGQAHRRSTHSTGSYPPRENGLQRRIRQAVIHPPLMIPYLSMAWYPYSEQDG